MRTKGTITFHDVGIVLFALCCFITTCCNGLIVSNNRNNNDQCGVSGGLDRRNAINGIAATLGFGVLMTTTPSRKVAWSLSPEEAATAYDSYAKTYDDLDGGEASSVLGIDEARKDLFGQATGSVLEIGAGTGLNLNKYDLTKVTSITLVDVSDGMLKEARNRVQQGNIPSLTKDFPISYVNADATTGLADRFGGQTFDCVTDSFSLCVMGTVGAKQCLDQIRQVVKKKSDGGKVLLLENSRSSNPLLGAYQDATADIAASSGGKGKNLLLVVDIAKKETIHNAYPSGNISGCVYNQDVAKMIKNTEGMVIENEKQYAAGLFRAYTCVVE